MNKNFKKYQKYIMLAFLLVVLVGCQQIVDPATGKVKEELVISLGDKFPFGEQGWFSTFIVWPISQLFNITAKYTGAFASVIIVTCFINILKFASTVKSTIQQQKTQLLQPELNRINEKYRGRTDQQSKLRKATETQKLYEKHGINPFGSLLPMLIQLPLIIAMYQAVQRADLIIHGSLFGQPFAGTPQQGFAEGNVVYITIFLVMVVVQAASMLLPNYLLKRKQRRRPYDNNSGPNMQGFMLFSLAMITWLAFTWNVGMSVYWAISALAQLIQSLYIQFKYTEKK